MELLSTSLDQNSSFKNVNILEQIDQNNKKTQKKEMEDYINNAKKIKHLMIYNITL